MTPGEDNSAGPTDGAALALATNVGFLHDIAQVRAKSALVELLGPESPQITDINWRYRPRQVLRNAAVLHHELTLRSREGQDFEPLVADNA
ncbi:MAG TPA: hypothetical protein PKB03_06315, partial [Baekduia sp.]|nr:hypothetical protein [Baekduia sp.]